ncbi:hypothetical protein ACSBR1_001658 [Camellia fascicularis]
MRAKGLYSIFSNYGVVVDTFILNKRRKMTRSRFGFVRYNCFVTANMAIQKENGLWCDDKALKVKMEDFGKDYAGSNTTCIIKAYEEGNGWLDESVIARLKPLHDVKGFKKEIVRRDLGEVQVRVGGGRDLVLSFQSKDIMKEELLLMKSWLKECCYGVLLNLWSCNPFINIGKVWGVVTALDEDTRNLNHFQYGKVKIVTSFMEPINQILNLECKGTLYPVRVCEEQIIATKDMKMYGLSNSSERHFGGIRNDNLVKEDNQIADRGSKHKEGDEHVVILDGNEVDTRADVDRIEAVEAHDSSNVMEKDDLLRDTLVVAESDLPKGMSEEIGYACKESSTRLLASPKMRAVDGGGRIEGAIQTSGLIKTICGPENMGRGINLVMDLKSTHEYNEANVALVLDHSVIGPSRLAPLTAGLAPVDLCNLILPNAPTLHSVGDLGHL